MTRKAVIKDALARLHKLMTAVPPPASPAPPPRMNAHLVIAELQAKANELDFDEKWTLTELARGLEEQGSLRDTQERDLQLIAQAHGVPTK